MSVDPRGMERGAAGPAADGARRDRDEESVRGPSKVDAPGARTYLCDLCGAPMLDLHCKLVCRRCGYRRDCSDP